MKDDLLRPSTLKNMTPPLTNDRTERIETCNSTDNKFTFINTKLCQTDWQNFKISNSLKAFLVLKKRRRL